MKLWWPEIERHINVWSTRLGNREWWPRYVYHFTDVNNAANIIRVGSIFSRSECFKRRLMIVDNASPDIIQQTKAEHLGFVRLYFRPKTPTQWHNEGIRPLSVRSLGGAHCPVPIFFCFDALSVLRMDETYFSDGNMGRHDVQYGNSIDLFRKIPFELVFHHGSFERQDRDRIIFHRHAEVLIPDSLSLSSYLKFVACRTAAERQTLLHLLPSNLRASWGPRIRIADLDLFERKWTFVEEVVVVDDGIIFRFNPSTQIPGPFSVVFRYRESGSSSLREWKGQVASLNRPLRIRVSGAYSGEVLLYLDDCLAFADTVVFDEIPF